MSVLRKLFSHLRYLPNLPRVHAVPGAGVMLLAAVLGSAAPLLAQQADPGHVMPELPPALEKHPDFEPYIPEPPGFPDDRPETSLAAIGELREELAEMQRELEQALANPENSVEENDALFKWVLLVDNHIIACGRLDRAEAAARRAQGLLDAGQTQAAQLALIEVRREFAQLVRDFKAAKALSSAEEKGEEARYRFEMYHEMKRVATRGPEAERAGRLYQAALARTAAGELEYALALWQGVEEAYFVRAYTEIHQGFAEAAKQAKDYVAERRKTIAETVDRLLHDHFAAIPAGAFTMGSEATGDEMPVHRVEVGSFKLGRSEIPFALWDLCVEYNACLPKPHDLGWGRDKRPVIHVSYDDIVAKFIPWLAGITGKAYRLPSEAEWEYAARAGSVHDPADALDCTQARFRPLPTTPCKATLAAKVFGTLPVKTYNANAWGLYDMHGNVREWVADCYAKNYKATPVDGSAHTRTDCKVGVLRGGSWADDLGSLRSSNRFYLPRSMRRKDSGFRLVEVDPAALSGTRGE